MVLHAGDPAARDVAGEGTIFRIFTIEFLVLGAVVVRRTLERIALDAEHRALHGNIVAQNLGIRGGGPRRIAAVVDVVLQVDAIFAATQQVRLGDRDARRRIRPLQRHTQLVGALSQLVTRGGRSEGRKVRRPRAARRVGEARLQIIELLRIAVEQAYPRVLALHERVSTQVGANEITAL